MKKVLGLILVLVFAASYAQAQATATTVTNRGEVITVYTAEGGGSTTADENTGQAVPADFTVGDDLVVTDDAAVGGDLAVTGAATVGASAVLTKATVAQVDTNATTTATAYTPAYVGQPLIGGAGTGTNAVWISKGVTTNDWVQVAP